MAVAGIWSSPVFVCLFCIFPHDISETDTARIAKLNVQMFHHESREPVNYGVKRSKDELMSHTKQCVSHRTLVSAGFV